jgi:glycosyltransferase involved in cell wall biosynthesis
MARIFIIGPAHPLRGGGIVSFNERLARAFQEEGHTCEIWSLSLQYPSFLFPGKSQYSNEPAPTDLTIHTVINSIDPLNWWKVGNQIANQKPDIILVRYWLPFMGPALGTILRRVQKNKHTTIICLADNVIPHEKRPGDKIFTQYFLKSCDAFITMSEKVQADLSIFNTNKPADLVAHPLYDNFGKEVSKEEARNHLKLNPTEKIILFFGFIRKYKGLDLLLEAMSDTRIGAAGIKLLIAGEFYENPDAYHSLIEKYQLQDRLILRTDFIPDSEVKYYLCAADAVVQPYRNATQSGVTPLSYHFEKPMLVTNVGGLPGLVPHEKVGLVCEPNAYAIANAILRFYELGEAHFLPGLKEEKIKYSWTTMVNSIVALSKQVSK